MGFLNTVYYSPTLLDNSWFSRAEQAADVCRAPSRWVATELWEGGKKYKITIDQRETGQFAQAENTEGGVELQTIGKSETFLKLAKSKPRQSEGIQKICRIVLGALFSLPGQILALPLMGLAFCSEEIRLKHKITAYKIPSEERNQLKEKLKTMIEERVKLANEKQGCEPVTFILFSICCLLCCLVCCRK